MAAWKELMPNALVVHFVADADTEASVLELCRSLDAGVAERIWRHAVVRIDDAGDVSPDVHSIEHSHLDQSSPLTVHHIQSAAASGGRISWCSFELRALLVDCSLLHIHNPFTTSGEAAFALGKNLTLKCVLDCSAIPVSTTGWKWGMADLADVITCKSDRRAVELRRDLKKTVCVLGNNGPDIGTRLSAVYADLMR